VTRNAVSNAVSIAALLLTTESLVVEKPAEAEPAAAGGGHGHSHGGHGHQHGPGF
jgi:chaperonin GroEL